MWLWRTIARSPTVDSPSTVRLWLGMANGEEVEGIVEALLAEREVGGPDRRGEAVVEGLRQAEGLVDPVPAEADRPLVEPQPAGVEEPEDLDPLEAGLEQLPVLGDRVLAQVPGVVRLRGPGGREGEAVWCRDVGDRRSAREAAQQLLG